MFWSFQNVHMVKFEVFQSFYLVGNPSKRQILAVTNLSLHYVSLLNHFEVSSDQDQRVPIGALRSEGNEV